jgi:hypothetical protein
MIQSLAIPLPPTQQPKATNEAASSTNIAGSGTNCVEPCAPPTVRVPTVIDVAVKCVSSPTINDPVPIMSCNTTFAWVATGVRILRVPPLIVVVPA